MNLYHLSQLFAQKQWDINIKSLIMRKILLLTIISAFILSCQESNKKVEKTETAKVETVDNTEKIEQLFTEFKSLYQELLAFKNKADFKRYGLGEGGSYNKWLKKVEKLKNNPDSKLLLQKGILIGELEQLALAYVSSKGEETEVTKTFNKTFEEAINPKVIEKAQTKSDNVNYEKIKSEYELFGKWTITNTIVKQSYPFEIYKKGDEYLCVIPQDNFKTKTLLKKGNDYYIKGNKYGEFYRIDSDKNMKLFDKDGDLSSMGLKAIKK